MHSNQHLLKIAPEYFTAIVDGRKKFEVRLNDKNFQVNDILLLSEWCNGMYSGRVITAKITYTLKDTSFVKEGFIVMSIAVMNVFQV